MGIREGLFGERTEPTPIPKPKAARQAGPPKQSQPAVRHREVDVGGTWVRCASHDEFDEVLPSLPLGPVKLTMRLDPNHANPYGISTYIGDVQVGYLGTDWSATDPWVVWMMRLDAAGIWPRFDGVHRLTTDGLKEHIVNFSVPGRNDDDLSVIADLLISGE